MLEKLKNKFPKGIQFREDIYLKFSESSLEIHGAKAFSLNNLDNEDIDFLSSLKHGVAINEDAHLKYIELINLFDKYNFLRGAFDSCHIEPNLVRQLGWLSHFHGNANDIQSALTEKRVLIVGCGGTGCIIAEHLIRSGIKNMSIIDGAKIDEPDLNRQLSYSFRDVGKYKTDILKRHLIKINNQDDLHIETHNDYMTSIADFSRYDGTKFDLIINAADKPLGLIQKIVCDFSKKNDVPILFGSVGINDALIGPLLVSEVAKNEYSEKMLGISKTLSETEDTISASIACTNTWASAMIALEAFLYLGGLLEFVKTIDKSLVFNFFDMENIVFTEWGKA